MNKIIATAASLALAVGALTLSAGTADAAPHDRAEARHLYHRAFTDGCKRDFRATYDGMVRKGHAKRGDYTMRSRKHPGYVHQWDLGRGKGC